MVKNGYKNNSSEIILFLRNLHIYIKIMNYCQQVYSSQYLLNAVLSDLKEKCDIVHLDACPYYERGYKVTYRAYGNALSKKKLIEFYQSLGFTKYGKYKEDGYNCYTMILQMKKG